jgi:hypothetical protein
MSQTDISAWRWAILSDDIRSTPHIRQENTRCYLKLAHERLIRVSTVQYPLISLPLRAIVWGTDVVVW